MKTIKLAALCASLALGSFIVPSTAKADIVMDNTDASGVSLTGSWTASTTTAGYYGTNYIHDGNTSKGTKKVRYTPNIGTAGTYYVYARWGADPNRSTSVPITISYSGGSATVPVNQQINNNSWVLLGTYAFAVGQTGYVEISNTGTTGYVVADAVMFSLTPPAPTGFTATEGDSQVTLTWTASPGATSYNVKRATVSGGTYTTIAPNFTGTTYTDTGLTNGTGYYYVVTAVNAVGEGSPTAEAGATPTNLPNPWETRDIGAVGALGSVNFSGGTYTVTGSGADIAGSADEFRYVYQTATGDCTVVARVVTLQNTNAAAKAGVMIRESTEANSMYAAVVVTPSSGIIFTRRTSTGGSPSITTATGFTAPYWVKIIRSGNNFTAWRAPDVSGSAGSWSQIGSTSTFTMATSTKQGFGVSSHADGTLCTATFDNLSPGGTAPTAPTGLGATAVSSSQINLAWTASPGATGYKIERSATGVAGTYSQIDTAATNSYSNTGLVAATAYYYRVRANNGVGDSGYSNTANATTLVAGPNPPGAPTFPSGSITSTGVTVNWPDNSSDETSFKVERKLGVGGSYSLAGTASAVAGTGGTGTFADTGLAVFTQYYYRVKATNAGVDSAPGPEMPVTTLDTMPAVPTGVTINTTTNPPTSNTMTVSWNDNSNGTTGNETGFKIERKTGAGSFAYLATAPAGTASVAQWVDSSVASGTSYAYRVSATNSGGTSAASAASASVSTPGTFISTPSAPTTSAVDSDKIDVTIGSNANAVIVERSLTGTADSFAPVGTIAAGDTVFHDSGLSPTTTYYYRVRATSGGGTNNSSYTAPVSRATLLVAPSGLTAEITSPTSILLRWNDNATGEGNYRVERDTGTGFNEIAQIAANSTSYSSSGLTTDATYSYRVRCASSAGSLYSNVVTETLFPTPTLAATAVSSGQINLTWTDSSANETGFKIERRADVVGAAWSLITTTAAGQQSYPDSGLSANTPYVYRIRYTNANNDSNNSSPVNATTWLGGALPTPWLNQDIGSPTVAGNASYASGTFGIRGSGEDTNDYSASQPTTDKFHYVYQSLNGDGTIVVRVASLDFTNQWANTGIMIRETLTNSSDFAMVGITPGYGHGTFFLYRPAAGKSTRIKTEDGISAPYWLKLIRSGSTFTGYKSSNGTTWNLVGSVAFSMASNVYVGIPVCGRTDALCNAVLDNVSVTPGATAVPSAPTGLVLTPFSATQINLSWTDNASTETGFSIERSATGAADSFVEVATVGTVAGTGGAGTYQNTGLTAGAYYYRVRAYNAGGYSAYTNVPNASTVGGPVVSFISKNKPATASNTKAGSSPANGNDGDGGTAWTSLNSYDQWWRVDLGDSYALTKVEVDWSFPTSRYYGYTIDVSNDDSTYTTVVNKPGNTQKGTTVDTLSTTARFVRVTVKSSNATTGDWISFYECRVYRAGSEPAKATLPVTPITNIGTNQLTLNWVDNSSNETGFKIERQTATSGSYTQIATVGAGVTSYQDLLLSPGTQYSYRVRAYSDTDGDALDYSDVATATTSSGGSFTRQYWTGVTGAFVSDLTTWQGTHPTPNGSSTLTTFEGPYDWADSYGQVITGLVHPPTTGSYTFWIASDNTSELWLSTDSNPANIGTAPIAKVEDSSEPREWAHHARNKAITDNLMIVQESMPVTLTAGQNYYIKVLHKAGTTASGPDHVAVAWKGPGFSRQVLSDSGSPLTCSITSPADGAQIAEGSNITINASPVAGSGRSISKVEFILGLDTKNEKKLGEDTTTPYSYTWNSVAAGSYVLITRAWDDQGVSVDTSVKVMVTNTAFGSGTWAEKILNGDGSINWTEYANVANSYDTRNTLEYRLGPPYAYYHPTPETLTPLPTQAGEDGITGRTYVPSSVPAPTDWYSEGGQMIFSANPTAPSKYQPGVARAWNGDVYPYDDSPAPKYCFINGVQWNNEEGHGQSMPDESVKQPAFLAANGGTTATPIATVRTRGTGGTTGFLLFKNGFITGAGNSGSTDSYKNLPGDVPKYAFTQLAAGKIPTAGSVTLNNEFLLVTVWDTINHKGQVAVVAVDGQIRAQQTANNNKQEEYFWGLPSRFKVRSLKVLGYIDLPFAAPTSISASNDLFKDGLGEHDNDKLSVQLDTQAIRDEWFGWSGSAPTGDDRKSSQSGYAVVASRAENKVAFLDLQPLFEYYREMYFTTQANYDLTKNQGPAANQWPYALSNMPVNRVPTVYQTITVTNPTAVMAGPPQNPNGGTWATPLYKTNVYIATMDGHLLKYNVGDLMTTASGGSIGAGSDTPIGKNPTSIDNNVEWMPSGYPSPSAINCRGDKSVVLMDPTGSVISTLKDSRIQDAAYTALSDNGRGMHGTYLLHVMDFEGSQIQTYRFGGSTSEPPIDLGTNPSGFEFTHTDPLPGCPFMFIRCGIN